MKKLSKILLLLVIFSSFLYGFNINAAVTWSQKSRGSGGGFAQTNDINSDGSFIVEAPTNQSLYKTTNQGTNWTSIRPGVPYTYPQNIVVDNDGSYILVNMSDNGGGYNTYYSSDSGANWSSDILNRYSYLAIDSDGSVMLVAPSSSGLPKLSTNSGASFSDVSPAGANRTWGSVCSDADGSVLVAGSQGTNGRLWVSTNTGANWTEVRPAGDADKSWTSVACSSNGSKIIATIQNGLTYLSTDTGANWSEVTPSGSSSNHYYRVDVSDDGTVIIAFERDATGRIWISQDSGANWAETRPIDNNNYQWIVSLSRDGTKMWATIADTTSNYSYYGVISPPTSIKTINSLAKASVKNKNGLTTASVKSINGLQ